MIHCTLDVFRTGEASWLLSSRLGRDVRMMSVGSTHCRVNTPSQNEELIATKTSIVATNKLLFVSRPFVLADVKSQRYVILAFYWRRTKCELDSVC